MYNPFPRVSTGSMFTVLDATARNPVGSIWSPPANLGLPLSTKGLGAQPVVKYLYYNSTTNPTPVAGPAPVYYTDETFTTVSGAAQDAFITTSGVSIAGYLMPNTTAISGLTAAELNTSYVFVQIGGLLSGAWGPTGGTAAVGAFITGTATTGSWASTVPAAAANVRCLGFQLTAVVSSLCDVLVGGDSTFWGS